MIAPQSTSITITDVSLELFALLSGQPLTAVIPTPQNRDAWRRATLTKGTP